MDAITEVASKVTLVASSSAACVVLDPSPLPASTRWSRTVFLCSVAEVRVPARFLNKHLSWFWTLLCYQPLTDARTTAVVIDSVIRIHIARTRQKKMDSRQQKSRPEEITFHD